MEESPLTRYLAELVGTFFLVLVTGCSVFSGYWIAGPASVACALTALTYATSEVSGGHLNPAVSLAAGIAGRLPFPEVAAYCACQLVGGLLGALIYGALYSRSFALGPVGHSDEADAGVVELLYTFMFCLVFLNCDSQKDRGAQFLSAAVGLVFIAGSINSGTVSGGCLNPATALAIDLNGRHLHFGYSLTYVAAQLAGAVAAGALTKVLRPPQRGEAAAAIVAEFVGTFLLALTATLGALAGSSAVWAPAAALAALVFALGDISGAHLNPAVSLAVAACENVERRFKKESCGWGVAVAVQMVAGLLAGVVALAINYWRPLSLHPGFKDWAEQGLVEVSATCLLVLTVLATSTGRAYEPLQQYGGLAIGLAALAGGHASHWLAGGTMNPALTASVGIAGAYNLGGALRLVGFQLLGAAFGGVVLQLTHPPLRMSEGQPLLPPLTSMSPAKV